MGFKAFNHRGSGCAAALRGWLLGLLALALGPLVQADTVLTDAIRQELPRHGNLPAGRALAQYYAAREYAPVWLEGERAGARFQQLLQLLERSEAEGLRPADYGLDQLRALPVSGESALLGRLEVLASLAAVRLATDLQAGRLAPRLVDPDLFIQPRQVNATSVLGQIQAAPDMSALLPGWAPTSPGYRTLRQALARYRQLQAQGGWPLVESGPALKPGLEDPRILQVRQRLAAEGYPLDDSAQDSPAYDDALVAQVREFQARHGLEADAVIGSGTQAQMAIPVEQRIRQIELNMERLRWMPDDLGERHILVNIAAFELALVTGGESRLRMPVAVGRPYRRTPVFSGRMTYLEFNPTWTVPPTILREDMLPKLRRDAGALSGQGFQLLQDSPQGTRVVDMGSVDWQSMSARGFPYRLRQAPGPKNPLGRVKFMLPNEHNIYLHDTPDHSIFQKVERAFSSGCIRVAQARDLAVALLAGTPSWDAARVEQAMEGSRTQQVRLLEPLPVHLTYLTAWVDESGAIQFRNDLYGRDKRLAGALFRL